MDPTSSRLSCRTFGVLSTMTAPKHSDEWFAAHLLASRAISDKDMNMVSPTLDFGRVLKLFAQQTPDIDMTNRQVGAFDKIIARAAFADLLPMVSALIKAKKYRPLVSLCEKTKSDTGSHWLLVAMLGGKVPRTVELDVALEAIVIRHAKNVYQKIRVVEQEAKAGDGATQSPAKLYADRAGYYGLDMDIKTMGLGLQYLGRNSMDSAPLLNAALSASAEIARLAEIIGPSEFLLVRVEDEINIINSAIKTRQLKDIARSGSELRRDPYKPQF